MMRDESKEKCKSPVKLRGCERRRREENIVSTICNAKVNPVAQ